MAGLWKRWRAASFSFPPRLGSFEKTLSATVTTAGAKGARAHRRGCPSRSPIRAMFKLTKLHKAVTEALNAVPNVDDLAKSLGAVDVRPRVVSEHGGLHSATCIAYEPVQRLLAVGVDAGVKIIGGDGVEVLLATRHHVEPARCVEFMPGVGRVMRVSVDNGIDVFDLHSQTCLASTRWPIDVTCACGMKDSPFVMVGESTGRVAVAAVQHGADGDGILAPRSYSIAHPDAFGRYGKSGKSGKGEGLGFSAPAPTPAVVAVKPQPRRESTRVLIAYADGSMSLWDLHRRRPLAAYPPIIADDASPPGESPPPPLVGVVDDTGGSCVRWVGGSGRTVAVAHIDGSVATYDVPTAEPGGDSPRFAHSARTIGGSSSIAGIVRTRVTFPSEGPPAAASASASAAGDGFVEHGLSNTVEQNVEQTFEPTRRICAVAAGGPFDGWANSRAPTGAVLCVGGESVGAVTDPARIVSLRGWRDGDEGEGEGEGDGDADGRNGQNGFGKTWIPMPWFGAVLDAVLIPGPPGRADVVQAAAVLSEGGQIHVHDLRFIDGGAGSTGGISPGDAEAPTEAPADSPAESSAPRFPCAEVLDPMPSLSATCDPACALASPRLSSALTSRVQTPAGTKDDSLSFFSPFTPTSRAAVDRAAWGREWPVSGARVDEKARRWASRRERLRHVLAIPSGGSGGNVRVFSDGDPSPGKLTELAIAAPGPNAGTTVADRAVTRCHVALGGCVLVIGRACGAVEVHAVRAERASRRGESSATHAIRQLDSGLDLASAVKGGGTGAVEGGGYELVAELGSHAAQITSIATDAICALLAVGDADGVVTLVDLTRGLMMTSTKVFSQKHGEGVGCMELCPRIVGTGTGSGIKSEGSGGPPGDAEVAGSNPDAAGDADINDAYGRNGQNDDAPPVHSRFPGADVLCVASTESAVAFLDVALGTCLGARKTQLTPKTPSRALAVAPLTMNGTPPRSTARGRGADGALRAFTTSSHLWFNVGIETTQSRGEEDEPAHITRSTGAYTAADEATGFVAVASEEAIRVYPAHGAARGERHTVKKASTAEEPLVFAALVAPVAPDDDDSSDDTDDVITGDGLDTTGSSHASVTVGNGRVRPAAFAAVSSRGRLLVWSLPGLIPLRSLGPVPCLSVADGVGFCVDGALFASAGGGGLGSVAKLALAPPKGLGGAKAGVGENGLALVDVELAAAITAAESAATFDAQRPHPKAPPGGGHPPASVQSPFSPEGTPEKEKAAGPKPKNAASAKSDLTKSMNSFLKGDSRAALASFGSVMRATKEKANAAMAQAKSRIKESMGDKTRQDDGLDDSRTSSGDKTAADLAFLFAEPELLMDTMPGSSGVSAVSTAGAGRRGAGSSSTGKSRWIGEDSDRGIRGTFGGDPAGRGFGSESAARSAEPGLVESSSSAQPRATGDDADRAALFGISGSSELSSGAYPVAPKVNTAADIRAKYGVRKKAAHGGRGGGGGSGDASLATGLEETRGKLHERGERLRGIQDKTERMQSDAEDFASMAEKLRKQQEKSWW